MDSEDEEHYECDVTFDSQYASDIHGHVSADLDAACLALGAVLPVHLREPVLVSLIPRSRAFMIILQWCHHGVNFRLARICDDNGNWSVQSSITVFDRSRPVTDFAPPLQRHFAPDQFDAACIALVADLECARPVTRVSPNG
jgi:hypothetical protein